MLVPMPAGNNKHVALGPVQALLVDDRVTRTAKNMIDRCVIVAMLSRMHAGAQLLRITGDGGHHRTAGMRIKIFEPEIVVKTGVRREHFIERLQHFFPRVFGER